MARTPHPFVSTLLGAALFAAATPAQIGEGKEPQPIFRVRSMNEDVLKSVAAQIGGDPNSVVRAEKDGKPYGFGEVAMLDNRKVSYAFLATEYEGTYAADTFAELFISSNKLVDTFGAEYKAMSDQLRLMVGPMLAMQGADAREVSRLLNSMIRMPEDILAVFVRVHKDPREMQPGTKIQIDLVPRSETDLAFWVRRFTANPGGAPMLPNKDAVVDFALSLDPDVVKSVLGPLADAMSAMSPGSAKEREAGLDYMYRFLGLSDGTMRMTVDKSGRSATVMGIRNAEEYTAAIQDKGYLDWWQKQLATGGGDAEVEPGALIHRDIQAMKVTVDVAPGTNPMMPDGGTRTGYRGVVGNYDIEVSEEKGADQSFQALADAILDQKMQRGKLPAVPNIQLSPPMVRAVINIENAMQMLPPGTLPQEMTQRLAAEGAPKKLIVSLGKVGITLKLVLELQ